MTKVFLLYALKELVIVRADGGLSITYNRLLPPTIDGQMMFFSAKLFC
jgi:hypothetical protein